MERIKVKQLDTHDFKFIKGNEITLDFTKDDLTIFSWSECQVLDEENKGIWKDKTFYNKECISKSSIYRTHIQFNTQEQLFLIKISFGNDRTMFFCESKEQANIIYNKINEWRRA